MPRERTRSQKILRSIKLPIRRKLMTLAVAVIPRIYMLYMRFVFATSRVDDRNFAELHEITLDGDGAVGLLWHEEVFTVAYGYQRFHFNAHTLASHGDLGAIITNMLEQCDFTVFRGGSSSRASRHHGRIVSDMIEHMHRTPGVTYGITVDGSNGPAYRVKPGAILIAQECGKPIALGRTWYKRSIRLKTWDRTAIPLPFNDIRYSLRGPYAVPEDAETLDGFARFWKHVEDELIELALESYREFDQPIPNTLIPRPLEEIRLAARELRSDGTGSAATLP